MFGDKNPSDVVYENTADGFVDLCRVFCILAEQGELSRRYEGHDKSEVPDEGMLRVKTAPYDVIAMRQGVISAITNGYKREIVQDETDLGLAELQKKNEKLSKAHYLRPGAVNGLGEKETMMLPVGVVFDLLEIYIRAHRPAKNDTDT